MTALISQPFPSPIGLLHLVARGDAIAALTLPNRPPPPGTVAPGTAPVLALAAHQLTEYFAGERTDFDLPLAADGTAFQHAVWDELVRIPFGTTSTYQSIARALGRASGSRAVGAANGRNRSRSSCRATA